MLSNISKLQVQVDNKIYQLLCDSDSPLPSVKEALFQFQKYVGQVEDQIKVNEEANKKVEEEKALAAISQEAHPEESKVEEFNYEEPKLE